MAQFDPSKPFTVVGPAAPPVRPPTPTPTPARPSAASTGFDPSQPFTVVTPPAPAPAAPRPPNATNLAPTQRLQGEWFIGPDGKPIPLDEEPATPAPPKSRGQAAVDDLAVRTENAKALFNTWVKEGPHRVVEGISELLAGDRSKGIHSMAVGGGLTALALAGPEAVPAIVAAPGAAALTIGGATLATEGGKMLGEKVGLTPDQSDVLGDITGAGVGTAIAKIGVPALIRRSINQKAAAMGKAYEAVTRDTMAALGINQEEAHLARPFLEEVHANGIPIEGKQSPGGAVEQLYEAAEASVKTIERFINSVIARFPNAQIGPVHRDVARAVLGMHATNAEDVQAARGVIEKWGLDQPMTLAQADDLRIRLNAENRRILSGTGAQYRDAVLSDAAFVARKQAADSLRDGVYNYFEAQGVDGIRDTRRVEGALLKVRNAADPLTNGLRGEATVARTGHTSAVRRGVQRVAQGVGAAFGLKVGGAIGHPVLGSMTGAATAGDIASGLTTPNMSKNALLERAFAQRFTTAPPMATITGPGARPVVPTGPAGLYPVGLPPGGPGATTTDLATQGQTGAPGGGARPGGQPGAGWGARGQRTPPQGRETWEQWGRRNGVPRAWWDQNGFNQRWTDVADPVLLTKRGLPAGQTAEPWVEADIIAADEQKSLPPVYRKVWNALEAGPTSDVPETPTGGTQQGTGGKTSAARRAATRASERAQRAAEDAQLEGETLDSLAKRLFEAGKLNTIPEIRAQLEQDLADLRYFEMERLGEGGDHRAILKFIANEGGISEAAETAAGSRGEVQLLREERDLRSVRKMLGRDANGKPVYGDVTGHRYADTVNGVQGVFRQASEKVAGGRRGGQTIETLLERVIASGKFPGIDTGSKLIAAFQAAARAKPAPRDMLKALIASTERDIAARGAAEAMSAEEAERVAAEWNARMAEGEPVVDVDPTTGEGQTRLPGTEGARRPGNAPTMRAPVQATGNDFDLNAPNQADVDAAARARAQRDLFGK